MRKNIDGTYFGTANLYAKNKGLTVGKIYLVMINGPLAKAYEPSSGKFLCQLDYRAFNDLKKTERM